VLIEVFSDVVCPWCFLGKRRLDAALAERPGVSIEVSWLPFELNPNLPRAGVDRTNYLADKFGGPDALAAAQRKLVELGREADIEFRFDLIDKVPHTRAAHLLLANAPDTESRIVLLERLFRAYFEQGIDIGDPRALAAMGEECGLDVANLAAVLADEECLETVARDARAAAELGISGVPTFVFERRYMLSGAQPAHVLLQVVDHLDLARATPPAIRAQG
jgi:predicted DsbA family dithiol-disulfide isomerase